MGGGVQLCPLCTAATNRPTVPAPGDFLWWWRNWCNDDWQGKRKYSEKNCPIAALSTLNPTCCPDANPGHCGGKPATNRLNYGTAFTYTLRLVPGSKPAFEGLRANLGFFWPLDLSNETFCCEDVVSAFKIKQNCILFLFECDFTSADICWPDFLIT
jgi:hypothetical protein